MNIKHIRAYLMVCSLVVILQPLPGLAQQNLDAAKTSVQQTPATVAPEPPLRDGQHDFDFHLGYWKTHIRSLQHPLTENPMPLVGKLLSIPLLLLLACLGCSCDNPKILPDQLNGFWTTDVPRYQDRFLEFDRVYVFIGVGRLQVPTLQNVDKVEAEPAGKETTYTIYSSDREGNSYQMTLQFNPMNGGEIQLKSQQGIVWKRPTQKDASPEAISRRDAN